MSKNDRRDVIYGILFGIIFIFVGYWLYTNKDHESFLEHKELQKILQEEEQKLFAPERYKENEAYCSKLKYGDEAFCDKWYYLRCGQYRHEYEMDNGYYDTNDDYYFEYP